MGRYDGHVVERQMEVGRRKGVEMLPVGETLEFQAREVDSGRSWNSGPSLSCPGGESLGHLEVSEFTLPPLNL